VLYRWHPWFHRKVRVHRSVTRKSRQVLRCSLADSSPPRILEVPRWMFDRAVCCLLQQVESPVVGLDHLRALRDLLASSAVQGGDESLRTVESLAAARRAETDDEDPACASSDSTGPVSPATEVARLELATDGRPAKGQSAPGSPASRASNRALQDAVPSAGGVR
jgi:hypothetical protein